MDKKYISCLVNDKVGVCAISLVLDKRHVRNGGKYPIALRFTIDRKRLYYPLGDKYTEKEFDAICRAKIQVEDPILRVRRKQTLSVRCF